MSVNEIQYTTNRFSDVAGEPCIMLAPIEGVRKMPLVTLEEATEPLIKIVPRIKTYVHVVKQRATNPADDLSVDESASIALYTIEWEPYTESVYYILNSTLRTEDRQRLKPWFLYLKLILTALYRLPSISLTVYRGVRFAIESEYEKYQTGRELVWWGFSSCSTDRNISEKDQFLGQTGRRTLFIIDCIKGKNIGKHSYYRKEREVLLLPATKIKVINYEYQRNGLYIVHLQEIESSFILLEPMSSEEEVIILKNRPDPNKKSLTPKTSVVEPDRYFNPKLNEYIARCKPRSEVFLFGKHFNEDDVEVIVRQLIIEKQCRELFLRESGITSEGAIIIANALRSNNTLERLFISRNKIGDKGAEALARALSNNNNKTFKQLCLGSNEITDEGIEHIAIMLASNKTLTHLWLPSNKITDHGLKKLAEVLTNENTTLQLLSLEWNKFRDDANINILIAMLNKNQSLTTLNLNSCKLPRAAIKQLKTAVKTKENFKLIIN